MELIRRLSSVHRRRPRPAASPAGPFVPGVRPMPVGDTGDDDMIEVAVYEQPDGRLVLFQCAFTGDAAASRNDALLRIGRARIALHHLSAQAAATLLAHGTVVVEGPDALNVLLALVSAASSTPTGAA